MKFNLNKMAITMFYNYKNTFLMLKPTPGNYSKNLLKYNSLTMMFYSLIKLPTPININILWNFGSLLGLCLIIQIISGLFLTMHYCPNIDKAFDSIIHIIQDVNYGWLIRNCHMNGASLYFICMYIHIGRGLYYYSYKLKETWLIGVTILLLSMATAFLGYVLPWGQMSLWGATVITNLLSAIPYVGNTIVYWLWGGFSINNVTLNRFYTFHFILPFIILMMVLIHLMYLHETGSSNPMGLNSNIYKVTFHPYFVYKDLVGFMLLLLILMILILQYPYLLSDSDNFIPANPMVTPIHIQPEWYFLFAYAILRVIPSKLGGVVCLFMSICMLYTLPLKYSKMLIGSNKFYPLNQFMFYMFITSFFILTWVGAKPIEYPYINISEMFSLIYFSYFISMKLTIFFWNKLMYNKFTNLCI